MSKIKFLFFMFTSLIIVSCGNPASNNNSSQKDLSASAIISSDGGVVLNYEIVTDDMAETDCISIPSDNLSLFDYKYYGDSDLSTNYYKCDISFEKK